MKERSTSRHKVAHDALSAVEKYASSFDFQTYQDIETYLKAEDLLGQISLPPDVKERVKEVAHTILRRNIVAIKLLEKENRRKVELLEEENKRKA